MTVRVEVRLNRLGEIARALPQAARDLQQETLTRIDEIATANCPVDTGNLKNSRSMDEDRIHWQAAYAAHVNFGTRYMAARPFVSDAVSAVMPSAQEAADDLARRLGL